MGEEAEADERKRVFAPYQVNEALMAAAGDALFMHCLPAHRGEEVTDEVIESPASVVFDQAENRLHTQKALLALLLPDAADRRLKRPLHHVRQRRCGRDRRGRSSRPVRPFAVE